MFICDLDDPDNFEDEYLEFFGEEDGGKMITIVNENYDEFEFDVFDKLTDNSKKLFSELSEQTKMELYYDVINSNLMIYPLNKV